MHRLGGGGGGRLLLECDALTSAVVMSTSTSIGSEFARILRGGLRPWRVRASEGEARAWWLGRSQSDLIARRASLSQNVLRRSACKGVRY